MQKHNDDTIRTSGHSSLEKYTSHFIEMFVCERWVGDRTKTATCWPPPQFLYLEQHFFLVLLGCSIGGPEGPLALCWVLVLSTASFLQLIWTPCRRGYIIIWRPPISCERHIFTQFNPSTVKVIPSYLRPDAPVFNIHRIHSTCGHVDISAITLLILSLSGCSCLNILWYTAPVDMMPFRWSHRSYPSICQQHPTYSHRQVTLIYYNNGDAVKPFYSYSSHGSHVYWDSLYNHQYWDSLYNHIYGDSLYNLVYWDSLYNHIYGDSLYNHVYRDSLYNHIYGDSLYNLVYWDSLYNHIYGDSLYNHVYRDSLYNHIYGDSLHNHIYGDTI